MAEGRPDGRITAKVNELDIPVPSDLDEFIARLERQRGRTIRLFPFTAGSDGPCGVWISTAEADYIYHERETTSLHKAHIVLHEIGHMMLGHQCSAPAAEDLARTLAPDVGPELIRLVPGRSGYTSEDEREAETFASLVPERASRPADAADFASRYATDPVILAYLLIYLGYLGVAGTGGMRMSWRYAPRASGRYLRLGLRLMASGSFTGLLYVGYNAAVELGRWFGMPALSSEGTVGPLLGVLATIQIVAGTTIGTWGPALETRLRQLGQLRAYRQLQPLWAALYDAVPEIALPPGSGSRPGIGFRLYRRVIEIRDGELALRAFRDPAIIAAAAEAAREAGLRGDTLATTVEAAILATAIQARKSGQAVRYNSPGAGPLPEPRAAGPGPGLDSEIAWLVKVSRAFTPLTVRPPVPPATAPTA